MVRMIKNRKELFSLRRASNTVTLVEASLQRSYDNNVLWFTKLLDEHGSDQNNIQLDAQKTSLNVL